MCSQEELSNKFSNKDFWKAFKAFNKDSCSIPALENNGIEASSDIDKAELLLYLLEHFNSSIRLYNNRSIDISISDILFMEEEVCQSLKQLNTTKAPGGASYDNPATPSPVGMPESPRQQ